MGCDFTWAVCPAFELTDDRKAKLREFVATMDLTFFREYGGPISDDDSDEQVRATILELVNEAANCDRQASLLQLPGMDYSCWITGGLTWGDVPTDCFTAINISALDPLWSLFVAWSKEDMACSRVAVVAE